jgi:hypothetical protein
VNEYSKVRCAVQSFIVLRDSLTRFQGVFMVPLGSLDIVTLSARVCLFFVSNF